MAALAAVVAGVGKKLFTHTSQLGTIGLIRYAEVSLSLRAKNIK